MLRNIVDFLCAVTGAYLFAVLTYSQLNLNSYEIAQNAEVMRSHFESVLASRQHVLEAKGADYREVAAFLVNNAALLRAGANDADELRQMITALKEITLAALQ